MTEALTEEILRLRKLVVQAQKTLDPFPRDQDEMLRYFDDDHMLMIAIPVSNIREILELVRKLDAEVGVEECRDTQ